jgi:hypothetical protein
MLPSISILYAARLLVDSAFEILRIQKFQFTATPALAPVLVAGNGALSFLRKA